MFAQGLTVSRMILTVYLLSPKNLIYYLTIFHKIASTAFIVAVNLKMNTTPTLDHLLKKVSVILFYFGLPAIQT